MDSLSVSITAANDTPLGAEGDLPLMLPGRPKMRYDFPKAWHHFKELVKDKENTAEVAKIFEALPWRGVYDAAKAFLSTERGQRIRASEPDLVSILDDHASLRRLPKGTVAHAYCDFMEREGLSAQGLVDELDKYRPADMYFNDQVDWYFRRLRDTHDLMHVLTGYGRDALGEQCVLAFTYSQQPALAHLFLGYAGAYEIARRATVKVPVFRAVREGQKSGKACPRLVEMSIRDLLAMPLEEARQKLGISQGQYYQQAHAMWRAAGIDPYDLMAPVQKAA
ncbi:Coq4 family protein [Novosphingobium sp. APW14]|jgi:ubiquinone biosynthesis protein COQ4|uniref:Coq4 family protein n=1 Tax=Novosphingobium sp. APW14 TaxID=3077237 RepID=UPI0028DE5601|nr:Coq4 family protein [Novosphingobium sp. APW14]MDT9012047.1 Coq4 family protein [Novosphingobium sp. APW14]